MLWLLTLGKGWCALGIQLAFNYSLAPRVLMECLLYARPLHTSDLPLPSRVGHLWLSARGSGDLAGDSPSGTLCALMEA